MRYQALVATLICLAFAVGLRGAASEHPPAAPAAAVPAAATRPSRPARQVIQGVVEDADGRRVPGAVVFVLDADTGAPYSSVTDHPFTDMHVAGEPPLLAHATAGADGRFVIRGVFPGAYRVAAQSWDGVTALVGMAENAGDATTFRGAVDRVEVAADRPPTALTLKPAGTAAARVAVDADDTFVLVSTRPPSGDPLLGPLAWRGEFLTHLVGATYVRKGRCTMRGLPEGPLYLYALSNDRSPAVGTAAVEAKASQVVEARIPLLAARDGPLPVPDRLAPLADALRGDRRAVEAAVKTATGPGDAGRPRGGFLDVPLDRRVVLPGGGAWTVRDVATVAAYEDFNRRARDRAGRTAATTRPTGT